MPYYQFTIDDSASLAAFRKPFFLIFNVAVGGNWPGYPDDATSFPQQMVVDYVRIFEPTGSSELDSSLRLNLEEPAVDLVHMGVGNLRGWAISSAGIRKVEAFLDGELLGEIPYGGVRRDVGRVFPDIDGSDKSGFSMSFNYGGLSAGTHTIDVVAHSIDNQTASASAQFETVRFDKEFIGAGEVINLNAATSVLTSDQIQVENVSIAGEVIQPSVALENRRTGVRDRRNRSTRLGQTVAVRFAMYRRATYVLESLGRAAHISLQ